MNSAPSVSLLIHGGPNSIETVRAQGLSRRHPADRLQFLYRSASRHETGRVWHEALTSRRPDVVYVCNTASPGAPLAVLHRWRYGRPFILDTGDTIYEMARRSGIGAGLRLPGLWLVEQLAQRSASAVVVRGTRHQEYLRSQGLKRVELIRDGFSEQQAVTTDSVQALRRELGLEGKFVVGVMGSLVFSPTLGICYGWDLIQAMRQLQDLPVEAVVIGDGDGRAWLEAQARQAGVAHRVRFCGRIPYADVPRYLRLLDVALSTQTNNLPGQVRTTGKLPEYMAAGCFILASRVGEAALVLPDLMLLDYDGEVDPKYPQRLADRIRLLQQQPELLTLRNSLPALARSLCDYGELSLQWEKLIAHTAAHHANARAT